MAVWKAPGGKYGKWKWTTAQAQTMGGQAARGRRERWPCGSRLIHFGPQRNDLRGAWIGGQSAADSQRWRKTKNRGMLSQLKTIHPEQGTWIRPLHKANADEMAPLKRRTFTSSRITSLFRAFSNNPPSAVTVKISSGQSASFSFRLLFIYFFLRCWFRSSSFLFFSFLFFSFCCFSLTFSSFFFLVGCRTSGMANGSKDLLLWDYPWAAVG